MPSYANPEAAPSPTARPFAESHASLLLASRGVLGRARRGAFATHGEDGIPLGSLLRFAYDGESIFITIPSDSGHADNLARDSRASLLVADPGWSAAPERGLRVTLVGRARRVQGGRADGQLVYRLDVEHHRVATLEGTFDLSAQG